MSKLLIVNKKDKIIGTKTKEECHRGKGIMHRAFSILVFNKKGQVLLSKRSKFKLLWPLFWDNTCSSHPLKNEGYEEAGQKRLKKEFGFTCNLELIDKFPYQAKYNNIGSENELCALLVGMCDNEEIKPNPKEIADCKWVDLKKLKRDVKKNPQKYTPWLKIDLKKIRYKIPNIGQGKKKVNSILVKFTKIVDPVIQRVLISNVDKKFQQIVKYPVSTGGKRLRPALAIISCRLFGGKLKDIIYPAAGLEILHNNTLIVDDIIDNAKLRRGKPTCWTRFGSSIAQCIGIDYSASIFQTANKSKKPALVSELFAKTLKKVIDGEILDILFERSGRTEEPYVVKERYKRITEKDYFGMISKKTASLIQASCEMGGIAAGARKRELNALRKYGFNLGIVFQITDDILDIFGKEKKFKKKIGKDIEEKKEGNIVILLALKELKPKDRNKFLKMLRKDKISKKNIKEAMKLIKKTNSREKAYQLGNKFIEKAKNSLKFLPKNEWNDTLKNLADFILEREK